MKKFFTSLLLTAGVAMGASAAEASPIWLRDVAISPDGTTVAFTYKGDIYTVPVTGGQARQLTTNPAYDASPVWTPDGKRIAFRSNRNGSYDIFVMPAKGGTATRLTTASGNETPRVFLDNETLMFQGYDEGSPTSLRFPGADSYTVNINKPGERPVYYSSVPMLFASSNGKGELLYSDKKGVENVWRKHERAESTNDVWLKKNGKYTKLTDFNGHDRNPVWTGDNSFAYISEEDGTLNVYSRNLDGTNKKQLTKFTKHPVRDLSAAANGTLAFDWDGEIYTLKPGGQPVKLNVEIVGDDYDADLVKRVIRNGATRFAVSPTGEETAFVVRGDIYVTNNKYKTTKRITDTPGQERTVDFSADGRTLVYDSERENGWELFTATIKNPDEKSFAYATEIVEKPLYKSTTAAQQPDFSPDGKKVAFLDNRTELKVIDVDSKKVVTALPGKYNYSYQDGDIAFEWSPDSRWLLADYIGIGGWNNKDIVLVAADGSQRVNLTESGYSNSSPQWIMGGKGVAYETSKYGYKAHGSWGNTSDVEVMFLNQDGWDTFTMTEEEVALVEKADKEKKEKEKKAEADSKDKKGKKDKAEAKDKKESVAPLDFDLENRKYRKARITPGSSFIGGWYISPKGDKLYYVNSATEGGNNIYVRDLKKGDVKLLTKGVGGYALVPDKKGENLYFYGPGGSIKSINVANGKVSNLEFEVIYDRHPSKEREYMYDHMARQVKQKFHDVNMHGTDWDFYSQHYRKFLPYINNNVDFGVLLSEVLGELNASHTGGAGQMITSYPLNTGYLGAYYDESYKGEGLKVKGVLPRGPLTYKHSQVLPGEVILAIDGVTIAPNADVNTLLEGKVGMRTRLSVKGTDGKTRDVYVKPISSGRISNLRYQRWVERNEEIVDSISGGKIGYVHIQGMNDPSFRVAYDRILGKYRNCDAVVVDTRHNGGGWLHNDIALLLNGKDYVHWTPRGQYIGTEPFSQWTKPSVMLVDESNYSDAHGTPFVYKTLGIGKLVGAPVSGTMTAVWWETQIDPTVYFGIPQVTGTATADGSVLENQELVPDIVIYNDPAQLEAGHDAQLEGAVKELLRQTKNKK